MRGGGERYRVTSSPLCRNNRLLSVKNCSSALALLSASLSLSARQCSIVKESGEKGIQLKRLL